MLVLLTLACGGEGTAESSASSATTAAVESDESAATSEGDAGTECLVDADCPDCWERCAAGSCELIPCTDVEVQLIPREPGGCRFDLTMPPNTPPTPSVWELIALEIDGAPIDGPLEIDAAQCLAGETDGWIWLVVGSELELCGAPCASARLETALDARYPCPTCPPSS